MTPEDSSMVTVSDGCAGSPDYALVRKRYAENFPVALRLLPEALRADLVAVYDVARVIDDLGDGEAVSIGYGDSAGGPAQEDRTPLLEEFGRDLAAVWEDGRPNHPVLRRLVPVVRVRALDREPFERLVRANLVDQRVHRYQTYAELRRYCTLSAEPVGEIVLAVFGVRSPAAIELSDRICAALQLIEHWQDVAEDRRAGRMYLPQQDLAAFKVAETELDGPVASLALRQLMVFQTRRAAELLDSGAPLVWLLSGWARLAVAGYLAGGRAALAALRRVDGDVLAGPPLSRRRDVLWHMTRLLVSASVSVSRGRRVP